MIGRRSPADRLAHLTSLLDLALEEADRLTLAHAQGRCSRTPVDLALDRVRRLREDIADLEAGP